MIIGTSYFISLDAAVRYYANSGLLPSEVGHKLSEGLIHIGEPVLLPGERLSLVDSGLRYAIIRGE